MDLSNSNIVMVLENGLSMLDSVSLEAEQALEMAARSNGRNHVMIQESPRFQTQRTQDSKREKHSSQWDRQL